ncbi:type I polyketide synthase [Nocardia africana]|uniref:Beta-ketoacyl-acyl-carrier-protein synthase I n=1 Tax=Nocardia africana TaxID=134964 RepID=A0A378WXV7_9NOCA|nr:type I polyketide synthase [Nocardia africana]MCC3312601.1 type I polyketide synthase [Nocardia africana]SUA46078.1 Beta-ketoacyl-acyl-carrier-protein synthase I [Nocardia africana]
MSDIAIVGIGCRFAGGIDSPETFWDFVVDKRDGVVEMPADRWDYRRYYDPEPRTPGRSYTKRGAFMTVDPWQFDPDFFGISPREATVLDPQQRLMLEVTWEALDDAGMAGSAAGSSVGVYVGGFVVDQSVIGVVGPALFHTDMHTPASASYTMLSNRIAYALNLVGPALTVDTACSSSLVAFHLACQALDNDDCRVALAGGVNVMLQPETFVLMCKGGFLAADGRCKSFDASADGYGRGEGAGMVVLKKLDDAVRDGDRIYAVVKATGSNQDGRTTAITVPNVDSQEALARTVCERSGLAPQSITYLEAHGTGTLVGDPVELRALGKVFGAPAGRTESVGVGSVKATIGHTEAAAGVASVIKAALAITHRTLPPQGWLDKQNPDIPFEELGLHVQTEAQPLPADAGPMSVAVNGFGYGGTNAHAILQEYVGPAPVSAGPHRHLGILPISARSTAAARALAGRFADLITAGADPDHLAEAAWTRMAHHPFRTGVLVGDSTEDLVRELRGYAAGEGRDASRTIVSRAAEPVFVFSGMGPQHWRMGRELLAAGGVFAETAAEIDAEFRALAGWSIVDELRKPEDESRVTRTEVAQPANFLVQVGLVRELEQYGVTPAAIVGHSVGEVSAAYVSGMLSLRDAVRVAYHRARLQATTAGTGGMLAVGLPKDKALGLIGDDPGIDIAAVNSPSAVTLSGDAERLDMLAEKLTEDGVFARRLRVEVPYHSRLMEPIEAELRSALADLEPRTPTVPLYSTVTGMRVSEADWDASYWWSNVRQPVRFFDAVGALIGAGHRIYLEVGPHPVLSGNIREALLGADVQGTTVATLDREQADSDSLRRTLIGLHAAGVLDRDLLFPPDRPATPHLPLPRYPWQRTRLHSALPLFEQARLGTPGSYAMLGDPDVEGRPEWLLQVGTELLPWLSDHVVNGIKIMPGAAYLDAALSATKSRIGSEQVALEGVRFVAPLIMGAPDVPLVALSIEEASGRFLIRSRSATGTAWTVHASGRTLTGSHEQTTVDVPEIEVGIDVDPAMFYTGLAAAGLQYGPSFRRVTSVRVGRDVVVATVDGTIAADSGHLAHPAVVDAAMQCAAMLFADERIDEGVMVPVGVGAVRLLAALPETVTVVARRDPNARLRADVDLLDADHKLVVRLSGLQIGALRPGDDPLHRMADFYYTETFEERDPIDPAALAEAGPVSTVVVRLGESARADQLAALADSRLHVVDSTGPELESGLVEQLRAARGEPARRLHICVVAGAVADDVAELWTLKRIAVAIAEFVEPPSENGAPQTIFGDGLVHCTLVTESAFALPGSSAVPDTGHAALAGARRVLLNEQTALRWRLVDTEPATPIADLVAELAVPGAFSLDNSDEVLLRDGKRWATVITKPLPERLEALETSAPLTDPEANFELDMPRTRLLSALAWRECPRVEPGPGEIEIRMQVIGLNYKDPLKVIGLLGERELAPTYFGTVPGMEGVGTVVRVGPGVEGVEVGDLVGVAAKGMMRRFAVVDRQLAVVLPDGTDPGHCTSIIAFGTAEYALLDLARLEPGETVLVHGAAGGVGTAAIQVAKARGATIIGTASTPERRAHVLAMGADYAVNSRSLNFVDEVAAITGGTGADVIVSSAPGEILRQNFNAAAEFGRIVEVGKADIYTGGLLELANFDKNLSYFSMDLDRLVKVKPQRLAALLQRVFEKVTEGTYRPLPYDMFDTAEVSKAFEETLRSSRPARIALRMDAPEPPVRPYLPDVHISDTATYLITGGFGGFGLAIGRWLTLRGARRLVLAGRRGATTEEARRQLEAWRAIGIEIVEELLDVTDAESVTAAIARVHSAGHPLRGVFHAAGAVADNNLAKMELGQLEQVYLPKVLGAQIVHRAVADAGIDLDMFVLCSSGGSMYGIYGQYSYCAANVAVESLALRWAQAGERALCVGWGHLSGAGGMAANETSEKYLDLVGFGPIDMGDATAYLEQCLRLGASRVAVIPTDWAKLTGTFPQLARTGRTAALARASAKDTSELARLREELAAMEESKRGPHIARLMAGELAVVMGVDVDTIDMTIPVPELGLDSLMAVELGARVTKTLGIDLMSLQMGRSFSLEQAGPKVAELILAHEPGGAQPDPATLAAAVDGAVPNGARPAAESNGHDAPAGAVAEMAGVS